MRSKKAWRIVPRPLLETILNNHAQHHRVLKPLILHGPRGVGKTSLIFQRLLPQWNKGPHITGYVDFAQSIEAQPGQLCGPWASWALCPPPPLSECRRSLEQCLESMAEKGVRIGTITSQQIFTCLNKWHGLSASLRCVLQEASSKPPVPGSASPAVLWNRTIFAMSARCNATEIDRILGFGAKDSNAMPFEEASYLKESIVALKLAKKVIEIQQGWRANAVAHMNRTGVFSRTLTHCFTDWPCLLLELLSQAAEIDHFQPKLVINNIEVLKYATINDELSVTGPLYHDSLIWRIIALGANEHCLPVILVTSDSYYSYEALLDFGYTEIFISCETFGWTQQEAKMHMVPEYFSHSEWQVIAEVLGPNPRHLFELYALKESNYYQKTTEDKVSYTFEDIVDAYLAYLQITVVKPALDRALEILQKFAIDVYNGKVSEDRLRFGAPWKHPPRSDDPMLHMEWAKLQLMDFVYSLANTEFGVNYRVDYSEEIFDDPSTVALLQVGLLYTQRDPPFLRPISRGIQRCLVRWLVQQLMQLRFCNWINFRWHRILCGRYYRHLMVQIGYK